MSDFIDIYNGLTQKSYIFSISKTGTVATKAGKRVRPETLAAVVEAAGWDGDIQSFLECVATHLRATATPGAMRSDSQITKLESPLIAIRTAYGEPDKEILSHVRLVRTQDGSMVLLYTGDGEIDTYARVAGDPASIRAVLTHTPATPAYLADHPGASRLDELTAMTIRWCNALTAEVQGAEPAVAVAARVVSQKCPFSLIKSDLLRFWAHAEGDGTTTHKVADGFTLAGDWADLVSAQLDRLWGVRWLYMPAPPILTNEKHTPALHYIDLDTLDKDHEGEDISAWDAFMRKLSPEEGDVFKAYLWSIFDAKNRGRQLLYLMDEGYSGKSAVLSAIHDALGEDLCVALSRDSLTNQFAYSKVWNRRFVSIGDCKNPKLVRSQAMHSILGGDKVDVEYKGENSFTYECHCRVIVASNVMLEIDASARNEFTRILPIKINFTAEQMVKEGIILGDADGQPILDIFGRPKFIGDQKWPGQLKKQFWSFLATCKEPYEKLCPTHTDIILPDSCVETTQSFDEDSADLIEHVLSQFVEITGDKEDFIENATLYQSFMEVLAEEKLSERLVTYAAFKEHLRRRYHIEIHQSRKNGRKRGFSGIRLKADDTF